MIMSQWFEIDVCLLACLFLSIYLIEACDEWVRVETKEESIFGAKRISLESSQSSLESSQAKPSRVEKQAERTSEQANMNVW